MKQYNLKVKVTPNMPPIANILRRPHSSIMFLAGQTQLILSLTGGLVKIANKSRACNVYVHLSSSSYIATLSRSLQGPLPPRSGPRTSASVLRYTF